MAENKHESRPRGPMGNGGPMGMGRPGEKAKNFKGTFKRLLKYLAPHHFKISLVITFAILSTTFGIVGPKIMGKATTRLFEGVMDKMKGVPGAAIDFKYIGTIVVVLVGIYLISNAFSYIQQYIMAGVSQKTVYNLRKDISLKLHKLPLKYYDSKSHGDILSRITNDVDTISTTLQQSLTQVISAVCSIVGTLIMMLTISWQMTLIALTTIPVSMIVAMLVAKKSQKYFTGQQNVIGKINGHVEEMYSGHNVVKAFTYEEKATKDFAEHNEELFGYGWKAQFVSGIIMPLLMFIGNLGYVAVVIFGAILVSNGGIGVGDIQAFIAYVRQLTQPITQTAQIANLLQSTMAASERVFELLDEVEDIADIQDANIIEFPKGDVRLENVHFGYDPEKIVINNLNLDVKKGHTIAIVGPTGAGKTTLVNLIMRFYEINSGKILVDDVDITKLKREDLHSLFGMVLQDTWLFNGTIRDNIAYGREGATEEEIIKAADAAYADHFIRTLPEGYNTIINEDASNISQGQKQLLTIARAILKDPTILILDEATSSVDTRTEMLIQNAMKKIMKDRTSFVIAHRLSTIKNADLILVINNGDIVEQGTHNELLEQKGFYADLYNSQFTTCIDEVAG